MTLGRYNLACSNSGGGRITSRSLMDLKVILDATHEHMERLMIKHVNQRRYVIIYAFQSGERIRDALRPKGRKSNPHT